MDALGVLQDPDRLQTVRRLLLLDAPPKENFDRLTRLAAELLEAPIALFTLVDRDRQFFVSSSGLPEPVRSERQTSLEYSICQYAVAAGRPLVASDARRDPTLGSVLAVTELGVVAYAGVPLFIDGHPIGTLCVLDLRTRDWRPDEVGVLQRLADIATDEVRLHLLEKLTARRREWGGVGVRGPRGSW